MESSIHHSAFLVDTCISPSRVVGAHVLYTEESDVKSRTMSALSWLSRTHSKYTTGNVCLSTSCGKHALTEIR